MDTRAVCALLAASALALTACGPTQNATSATTTTTGAGLTGSSSTTASSTKASNANSSTTAPTTVIEDDTGVIHPCSADAFSSVQLESYEHADAGEGDGYVSMQNTSGKSCLLQGYPTLMVRLDGSNSYPDAHMVTDLKPAAADTVLEPGEWAGIDMSWGLGVDCQTPQLLLVIPPTNEGSISVRANGSSADKNPLHFCGGDLHISGWEKSKTAP